MSLDTEELVRELARGLVPVRRVAALPVAVAAVAGIWALFATLLVLSGTPLALELAHPPETGVGLLILTGLVAAAAGGLLAALGARVPGGARARTAGAALAGAGLAAAVVSACLLAPGGPDAPASADLACLAKAAALGLFPGAVLVLCVVRGASLGSGFALQAAVIGALAFGAALVHLGCAWPAARHLLLGHALAPLLAGVPLARLLRRLPGLP